MPLDLGALGGSGQGDESLTFTAADGSSWSPAAITLLDGFGTMPVKTYRQGTPYYDGALYVDAQPQPRVVQVGFRLVGASRNDLWAQRQQALGVLSPTKGQGTLTFVVPGVGPRALTCAVEEGPKFGSAGRVGVTSTQDVVRFVAADPAWYDPVAATQSWPGLTAPTVVFPLTFPVTFGTGSGGQATLTNAGDLESWPVLTFTGPGNNPRVDNNTTGLFVNFPNVALAAGDTLVLDHRPGQLSATYTPSGGSATNWLGYRSTDSAFWSLKSGANTVTAALANTTGASGVTASFFSRYSGV